MRLPRPGQIKADGGDQGKFDNGMREIRKKGIQAWLQKWPHLEQNSTIRALGWRYLVWVKT